MLMMSLKPPDGSFEEMALHVDLSTIKSLDHESAPSTATDDDSQHSVATSAVQDELQSMLPVMTTSSTDSNRSDNRISDNTRRPVKQTFKCDVCFKVFSKRSRLLSHIIVHSDEKDFLCVVCGKGFKNRPQLQRHSNTHSLAPNFCCNICGRGFKHNDVAKHIRRFHSGPRKSGRGGVANPSACTKHSLTSSQNVLSPHQSMPQSHFQLSLQNLQHQTCLSTPHLPQQSVIIQNQSCYQSIVNQEADRNRLLLQEKDQIKQELSMLREHSRTQHHSLNLGAGAVDSLSGSSNDSMQMCSTPLTINEYSCPLCAATFNIHSELVSHVKDHHRMKREKQEEKEHQCIICQKVFTRASGLVGHLQIHTRIAVRREPNPDLCCNICGKMFARQAGLKAHVLQHGGVLRFWCDEPDCGRGFVHSYQLLRHKRCHSDILPYSCDVCGRSFRHNDLAKHMRTHTGDKPYSCQHCGKAFSSSSTLRTHERMHIALKEHVCEICNMGFTTSAGLRRHTKLHEEEKEVLCTSCGKFLPSKLHFSLHMHESQHCSLQQEQSSIQPQVTQQLQEMPLPVSNIEELPQLSVHMGVQQPNSISIHDVHPATALTLTTLAATDTVSVVPEHDQPPAVNTLPVLVPFSLSVPIPLPFGISHNSTTTDQIQLNQFLSWEPKF